VAQTNQPTPTFLAWLQRYAQLNGMDINQLLNTPMPQGQPGTDLPPFTPPPLPNMGNLNSAPLINIIGNQALQSGNNDAFLQYMRMLMQQSRQNTENAASVLRHVLDTLRQRFAAEGWQMPSSGAPQPPAWSPMATGKPNLM